MNDLKLVPKRGERKARDALPLPVRTTADDQICCGETSSSFVPVFETYHGVLLGREVLVRSPEEARSLHTHGCFGRYVVGAPAPTNDE
jgi:hypothetical protein